MFKKTPKFMGEKFEFFNRKVNKVNRVSRSEGTNNGKIVEK